MVSIWPKNKEKLGYNRVIIGDEAGFALNGEVNSHNVRQHAPKGHPPAFNYS